MTPENTTPENTPTDDPKLIAAGLKLTAAALTRCAEASADIERMRFAIATAIESRDLAAVEAMTVQIQELTANAANALPLWRALPAAGAPN